MSVLVIGGAGYVGSHMVAALAEKGVNTVVLDNLEKGHREAVWPGAKLYVGDMRDAGLMAQMFSQEKISTVVHFAAYSLVAESMANPHKYYDNNVSGTLALLKSMQEHNVGKIVFSSTAAVYGMPDETPIMETAPERPINPYGESKLAVERMLKWFDQAHGIKYMALRYFNVAGAHESGKIGEDHNPETHLIPLVLQTAAGKREALDIYGSDYPTADGTCIRDYIHAMDLADAHILAMQALENGGNSAVYNLGSGSGFSNLQIVEAAKKITGVDFKVNIKARRPGDPPTLIASSEKIKQELGWRPTRTNIETIISTAWRWHKNNPNGFVK
ncbi:MAG: UDP-glucose 4-epimerase GalE [Defluviitaleaceae bacterium]|nr:UDP-glucose 4-epimerase GalE [Defluviitaleaceae bacterium]